MRVVPRRHFFEFVIMLFLGIFAVWSLFTSQPSWWRAFLLGAMAGTMLNALFVAVYVLRGWVMTRRQRG